MNGMKLAEVGARCGAALSPTAPPTAEVKSFAFDSREVRPGDLFVAVIGERSDGHDFVGQAVERGAVAALVERQVAGPVLLTDSVVDALARFGSSFRKQFSGPVIGITGSAGKTTTKEFVAAALSPLGPVLKTEGNRNTELTVPLVWADLTSAHRSVVIEMAMRGPGQIAHLASICEPTIGVITMIGHAHSEKVGSRDGVARAKAELLEALPSDGHAVLWAEDEYFAFLRERSQAQVASFGVGDSDCRIASYRALDWTSSEVIGVLNGETWTAIVPTVGRHMALDAAAAVLSASFAGVHPAQAAKALGDAKLPPMRMEVRRIAGATFVIDTYNASPGSTIAAIETLLEMPTTGRKLAVIGEMRELGLESEQGHAAVGRVLADAHLEKVLLFGEATRACEVPGLDAARAESLDDVRVFLEEVREGDVVLIKGSRALELERALYGIGEGVA